MGDVGKGFFSLVRWRSDVARDEARNVAILVVSPDEGEAELRAAPLSSVSPRLKDQGLLDSVLLGMKARLEGDPETALKVIEEWNSSLERSLYVTDPQPVAVTEFPSVVDALYGALVAPRHGGSRAITKGVVLDQAIDALRRRGLRVGRAEELGEFVFDAVVHERRRRYVVEVLSFAAPRKDWTPIAHDAGHFLYALGRVSEDGFAVVQPPLDPTDDRANRWFDRVTTWFGKEQVPVFEPAALSSEQTALPI